MDIFQYFLFGVLVLFIIWEVYGYLSTKNKIVLEGAVPGKVGGAVLMAVLLGFAIYLRRDDLAYIWLLAAGVVVAVAGYFFIKAGIGEAGVYANGKETLYGKMEFFAFERVTERDFVVRVHTKTRDFVLQYPADKKELVRAYFTKNGVKELDMGKSQRKSK